MTPTVLITGGAGYIGSHTALFMVQKGYQVIILDDFSQNQKFAPDWAKLVRGDFSDRKILSNIFKENNIESVMHFAGSIEVGESVKNPISFYLNNVSKTIQLLDIMLEHGVNKIIFSSSCAVYGAPEFLPLTEDHPKKPVNPYGQCKLMVETILEDLHTYQNLNYVSLRYFNAAGALPEFGLGEQHSPETHLIPLLLRAASSNKPFTIFGIDHQTRDGSCIRDFIHVWDIAYAHWLALEHLEAGNPSDCFNLGTGRGFSVKEMISAVENLFRTKIEITISKKRPGDPAILVADPTKANTILQWKPKSSELDFILRSASVFEHDIMPEIALKSFEN